MEFECLYITPVRLYMTLFNPSVICYPIRPVLMAGRGEGGLFVETLTFY